MSSKVAEFETFEGEHVTVEKSILTHRGDAGFFIGGAEDFYLSKEDAPAFALAVLEAAGWPTGDTGASIHNAIFHLKDHAKQQEKAKEAEALDKEALALCLAASNLPASNGWPPIADKGRWMAVARKARELHAKKSEPLPSWGI